MATTDEPQKIEIGGAGMGLIKKLGLLFTPIIVFGLSIGITYIFPNFIPPGNFLVVPRIDPITGQPLSLEPIEFLLLSLINGIVYGSTISLIIVIYLLRRRVKQRSL